LFHLLRWDFVKIYSIDSGGNEILLVTLSGYQSGSISSVLPTGKVKITFSSDVGVCYQTNPALYSGLNITFSTDTTYPSSTLANSYISGNAIVNGNIGIGVLNPSYKLEVNGTAKFLENIQCSNSITFRDDAHFNVTTAIIPNLRTSSFSMPIYGIASPLVTGNADLWLSGGNSIRMFTGANPTPALSIQNTGNVGIGTTTPSQALNVVGSIAVSPNGIISDEKFNGGLMITKPQASGQYINLVRSGLVPWSIGTVYNSSTFAIGMGKSSDAAFTAPFFNIDTNGYVGIGTTTPSQALNVVGSIAVSPNGIISDEKFNGGLIITKPQASGQYINLVRSGLVPWSIGTVYNSSTFAIGMGKSSDAAFTAPFFNIDTNGYVGIGTAIPDSKLTVNGNIHATEVVVDVNIPADYVFNSNYKLMPLHEVEKYVNTNNHLPEIPSASEIKKSGLNMGEMQNKLLQKVEELTLYMIDQQKTINLQSAQISQQNAKIETLEKKLK